MFKRGTMRILNALMLIISGTLSVLLFEFLFYKLNLKFGSFESIRSKIERLNDKKNKKLRVTSYILIIVMYIILTKMKMSCIIQGILFGLLLSLRDICFKITFLEIISNNTDSLYNAK